MESRRALLKVLGDNAEITQFFQNRPYTFISLETSYEGKDYSGYGFSKVMYPDKWDEKVGATIANRHALIMVLHQVRANERTQTMKVCDIMKEDIEQLLHELSV